MPVEELPNVNQTIIDSLQGYPCAQGVLAQMSSCNSETETILNNIFDKNDKVNVIFIADSTLPNDVNGKTEFDKVTFKADGTINFKIRLHTILLRQASKELIGKVMIHEAVHAYIGYFWNQYTQGVIDSNEFKNRFPKVWQYKKSNQLQHEQIAVNYLNTIKNFTLGLNPALADSVNTAMAWNGLTETKPWNDLSNEARQRMLQLYAVAKYGTKQEMQSLGLHKCP